MHSVALDRYDVRILSLLQSNSRLGRLELADNVGLSASQCFRRVKRLEEEGVIERYTVTINKARVGIDVSAMVMVQFTKSEPDSRLKLMALIDKLPMVQDAFSITGEYDFFLRVHCKTMQDFSRFINHDLQVSFVSGIHSYMLLECIKQSEGVVLI